jgi:uncharacterized repeat protein (TIGR03803 family)
MKTVFCSLFFALIAAVCGLSASAGPLHEVVANFSQHPALPNGGALVLGPDGNFWGISHSGGFNNSGTVYKFDPESGTVTTVVHFWNYRDSLGYVLEKGLTNDGNGFMWGKGSLQAYKVEVATGVLTVTGADTGPIPAGPVLASDGLGFLWGTTSSGGPLAKGTLFKRNVATGVETTVVEFTGLSGPNRGASPKGALLNDGLGFIWGTTSEGGSGGAGTLFKVNAESGVLTTLVDFALSGAPDQSGWPIAGLASDGKGFLWGITLPVPWGNWQSGGFTIYKVDAATGVRTIEAEVSQNPAHPQSELVTDDTGILWGTTLDGGTRGTAFKAEIATGEIRKIVEFSGMKGTAPYAGLSRDDLGFLWGTTSQSFTTDGSGGRGTIFKIDPATGGFETVLTFTGNDGARPTSTLLNGGDGYMWGTTDYGKTGGHGTVFKVNVTTKEITTVIEFTGTAAPHKGSFPNALERDESGNIWGTTRIGGSLNYGTVFKIDTATGVMTTVVEFTGDGAINKGNTPNSGLCSDANGFLWGTTRLGGAQNFGTVFKVNPATGVLTTLAQLTGSGGIRPGKWPMGKLMSDGSGAIWGTTGWGGVSGTNDFGTIFKLDAASGTFSTVMEFTESATNVNFGLYPRGGLLKHSDGYIYGTTVSGGQGYGGTIFRIDPSALPPDVRLSGQPEVTFEASPNAYVDAGATATDNAGNPLVPTITNNSVNPRVGGTYFVTWSATDGIGRTGTATRVVRVIDSFPPTISGTFSPLSAAAGTPLADYREQAVTSEFEGVVTITQTPAPGTLATADQVRITLTASDSVGNSASTSFTVAVPRPSLDGPFSPMTVLSRTPLADYTQQANARHFVGAVSVTQSPAPGTPVGSDSQIVILTARDSIGNEAVRWITLSIPTPFITITNRQNVLSRTPLPDFASVATTTFLVGAVNVTQSPAPGTLTSPGVMAVTLTATDSVGNQIQYTYNLYINRPTALIIYIQPSRIPAGTPLPDYRLALFTRDFAGPVEITQSPAPGTLNAAGTLGVTLTATDAVGNAASATFQVAIPSPTVTGTFSPLTLREGLPLPDYRTQAVATEFASAPTITQSPAPGTMTTVGAMPITLTATDSFGNTATTTFEVTVPDPAVRRTVLASKGASALVDGETVTWNTFGVPSINDAGDGLVMATYSVGPVRTTAVLSWDLADFSGSLVPVVKVGGPAPGIDGAVIRTISEPLLGPDGAVAWISTLANAPGSTSAVTSKNNRAIFLDADGGGTGEPIVVARTGQVAAGTARWRAFSSVALGANTLAFTATLSGANSATDSGIWMHDRATATTTLALRERASVLGSRVKTIAALTASSSAPGQGRGVEIFGDEDAAVARVTLANGLQAIGRITSSGCTFRYEAGDDATNSDSGATLHGFSFPTQGTGGALAFLGTVKSGPKTYPAIFAEVDSTLTRIVAKGDLASGWTGGVFSAFKDPVRTGNGHVLFHGTTAPGGAINSANNEGLWLSDPSSGMTLIAREGELVTLTSEVRWKAFTSLALPEGRGPIFVATLMKGGITSANNTGLWATDRWGDLRALLSTGDMIGTSTVRNFIVLSNVPGSPAQTRSYDNSGNVIVKATDTTGAQHLIHIAVP